MSYQEKLDAVIQYVTSLKLNTIAGYQINSDIQVSMFIKDKNIAIDFVPNITAPKYLYQRKIIECSKLGIRLIIIFEHEYDSKWNKIQSFLKSQLNIFDHKLYARDCFIAEIDSKTYKYFLDTYHLQSSINMSSVRYGLFTDVGELVSCIGFGFNRFKIGDVELHRFCTKAGYQVLGGFSKLIKHSNVKNFSSYVDFAHFSGMGYQSAGFEKQSITLPSYVYVKDGEVLSRIGCQKHKLQKRFSDFEPLKTEPQIMKDHGWTQVYDCGCIKMTYTNYSFKPVQQYQQSTLSRFFK